MDKDASSRPTPGCDHRRRSSSASSVSSSLSSISTTSLLFERLHETTLSEKRPLPYPTALRDGNEDDGGADSCADDHDPLAAKSSADLETGMLLPRPLSPSSSLFSPAATSVGPPQPMNRRMLRVLCALAGLLLAAWCVAFFAFVDSRAAHDAAKAEHDPSAALRTGPGRPVTLDQVLTGFWLPQSEEISWISGSDGEDGLLLRRGVPGKDYLVVEDVRILGDDDENKSQEEEKLEDKVNGKNKRADRPRPAAGSTRTLMKSRLINYSGQALAPDEVWPSPDLKRVLIATDRKANWRHSFTARYWILDVPTQKVQPLDPLDAGARIQLASWSPQSDAVVYTKDNNMFLRRLDRDEPSGNSNIGIKKPHGPTQITTDGGPQFFYGIPDWVYEEEVFSGNSATWWSADGRYIAFLRTNESGVPEFSVQYFVSRPSLAKPDPGLEAYPEVLRLKYPKVGAPNPVVDLRFYDVDKGDVFEVAIDGGFADDDRLVTNVLWAGDRVVVKETNRVSDVMRVAVVDVHSRTGKIARTVDVGKLDGGWFEISHRTAYVPADPAKGRPHDGYVDTVVHDNGDHLAYFAPLDAAEPLMLTSSPDWEVVDAPSAVDLASNFVYFVATKESSIQRHVYRVRLDGTGLAPVTNTSAEGYHDVSFSVAAGYALLTYQGPRIPWQRIVSTPGNPAPQPFEHVVGRNDELADRAARYELPLLRYGTLEVADGVVLNYVERRPPNFDPARKYPVLFYQYSGPGSQEVDKRFRVNFQSYVASALGYVVVTVDGRGTGFTGRRNRVAVRGHLGRYEALDQIAAGRHWAALPYVDPARLAIWGWSFGGFNALKTLETDAGATFSYAMAVAPVTDWRFYDSVYTERYMRTLDANPAGYEETAVNNATALGMSTRFLLMHGTADDNVHFQNSLTLLDKLVLAGIENYDVHVFPDSNHGIFLHNANQIVFRKLSNWLVNAFNGEWIRVNDAQPKTEPGKKRRAVSAGVKVE